MTTNKELEERLRWSGHKEMRWTFIDDTQVTVTIDGKSSTASDIDQCIEAVLLLHQQDTPDALEKARAEVMRLEALEGAKWSPSETPAHKPAHKPAAHKTTHKK